MCKQTTTFWKIICSKDAREEFVRAVTTGKLKTMITHMR